MTARSLSDLDDAEVARRYIAGGSIRQLADWFGVHRSAIERSLRRTNTPRRPPGEPHHWADTTGEEIVRLRAEGLTWAQIAWRTGLKPSGVRYRHAQAVSRSVAE